MISDSLSIRGNVNEATIWLSVIFSWMTPYEWYADLLVVVLVAIVNAAYIQGQQEKGTPHAE